MEQDIVKVSCHCIQCKKVYQVPVKSMDLIEKGKLICSCKGKIKEDNHETSCFK